MTTVLPVGWNCGHGQSHRSTLIPRSQIQGTTFQTQRNGQPYDLNSRGSRSGGVLEGGQIPYANSISDLEVGAQGALKPWLDQLLPLRHLPQQQAH